MEPNEIYRPPQSDLTPPAPAGDGGITPRMTELLKKTRPWVLFIAILGLVLTGLIVVVGLGVAVMMLVGDEPAMAGFGLVYLFMALIYFFPCYFLLKFAGAIKRLVSGGGSAAMEEALERQYSFWRLIGILALIVFALYALIIVVAIVAGAFAGFAG